MSRVSRIMSYQTPAQLGRRGGAPFWRSTLGVAALAFAVLGVSLLFTEHRGHVLGILPFVFVLACPLMHIFMHRGGGHAHHPTRFNPHREDPR